MVKIAKGINSNEYWSIDWKFAGIRSTGEENLVMLCRIKGDCYIQAFTSMYH